jgi:hypothetical protein
MTNVLVKERSVFPDFVVCTVHVQVDRAPARSTPRGKHYRPKWVKLAWRRIADRGEPVRYVLIRAVVHGRVIRTDTKSEGTQWIEDPMHVPARPGTLHSRAPSWLVDLVESETSLQREKEL